MKRQRAVISPLVPKLLVHGPVLCGCVFLLISWSEYHDGRVVVSLPFLDLMNWHLGLVAGLAQFVMAGWWWRLFRDPSGPFRIGDDR